MYSTTYANGSEFSFGVKNGIAIVPINANFKGLKADWLNIITLKDSDSYSAGDFLFSIPCNNKENIQILISDNSGNIQARYTGNDTNTVVVQSTLMWFTN